MKIIISYPGIPRQVIDASPNLEALLRSGKNVPYVEIADCTLWYRYRMVKDERTHVVTVIPEFNHLAIGHEVGDTPTPKTKEHASWKNSRWEKLHGTMTSALPPSLLSLEKTSQNILTGSTKE